VLPPINLVQKGYGGRRQLLQKSFENQWKRDRKGQRPPLPK